MIRILALLTLCTLSLPACATEVLINYPSKAALVQLATALGYYAATAKTIVAQATVDAGGEYFFNNVGAVEASPAVYDANKNLVTPAVMAPGLWARLRHNADPQRLADKIAQSKSAADALGIKIYRQLPLGRNGTLCWSADNSTCGPAYLDLIGVIA